MLVTDSSHSKNHHQKKKSHQRNESATRIFKLSPTSRTPFPTSEFFHQTFHLHVQIAEINYD